MIWVHCFVITYLGSRTYHYDIYAWGGEFESTADCATDPMTSHYNPYSESTCSDNGGTNTPPGGGATCEPVTVMWYVSYDNGNNWEYIGSTEEQFC